jgi:hypothetical protein
LRWSLIGWFALGAVPCAVAGGLPILRRIHQRVSSSRRRLRWWCR